MKTIDDSIYGRADIDDPLLIKLMDSEPVQRLKRIPQYGVERYLHPLPGFTRYDHSVGVLVLLRKFAASPKAQAAGLLHDVSHTAFSHLVDWVMGDPEKEDYQDSTLEEVIRDSEIPNILEEHGLEVADVIEDERYPLLERELPHLCADRIDYTLRELYHNIPDMYDPSWPDSLTVIDGRFVFSTHDAADSFGRAYARCQNDIWGNPTTMGRWHLFAGVLKRALEIDVILSEDFMEDGEHIVEKLEESGDDSICEVLESLEEGPVFEVSDDFDFTVFKKCRYLDPEYVDDGEVVQLSENDESYAQLLEELQERYSEEIGLSRVQ